MLAVRAGALGEAADDADHLGPALHLHPLPHPLAGAVGAVGALGHDPLEALLGRRPEEAGPVAVDVAAGDQPRRALGGDRIGQPGAALAPGPVEQPLAVGVEQVEGDVGERPAPVLEGVEVGTAPVVQHHHLAVEHHLLQGHRPAQVGQLGVGAAHVAAGAAAELGGVRGHQRQRPVAVPLGLERPGRVVERVLARARRAWGAWRGRRAPGRGDRAGPPPSGR